MHQTLDVTSKRVAVRIVDELVSVLPQCVDRSAVATCVGQALLDLRGSVSAEALPEMAARLALHRLTVDTGILDRAVLSG